jgi:hypothetical protein
MSFITEQETLLNYGSTYCIPHYVYSITALDHGYFQQHSTAFLRNFSLVFWAVLHTVALAAMISCNWLVGYSSDYFKHNIEM